MRGVNKPSHVIASSHHRSFSLGFRGAVRSFVVVSVIMTYEEQNLLVDSVCTDVTALAMVGANVREAPDTVLERFRPNGLQLYLLRNIDTAILVLARAKSIPIYALATREAVLWTRSSRGTVNSICGWGWTTALHA